MDATGDRNSARACVPVYLHDDAVGRPFAAVLHRPGGETADAGVLFCAPFGYDAMCAHRGLRAWANELAASGHAALRFDLPGGGDSAGGPRDPGLAATWPAAVAAAARYVKAAAGCRRTVAVGLGLGGILAAQAVAEGAPIDELALWGVPARGRTLVRELQAFSRLGATDVDSFDFDAAGAPPLPEGSLEAGGFLLSGETVAALLAVDLAKLDLGRIRRALVLGRDGVSADKRLVEALEAAGAQVEVDEGPGWSKLLDEPQKSVPPEATFARVARWLEEGGAPQRAEEPAGEPPRVTDVLELPEGVRERPLALDRDISCVLVEPTGERDPDAPCVALLNVGAERRTGPNRMWVEAARRWAARGVVCARIDLPGIGDAGGPTSPFGGDYALYDDELVAHLARALRALRGEGVADRFALVGLCSGAYWAFQYALRDARIAALLLINPRMLLFDETLGQAAEARHVKRVASAEAWRKVLQGRLTWARVRRLLIALLTMARRLPAMLADRVRARLRGGDELDLALDRLRDQGTTLALRFTAEEPLLDDLRRSGHLDRIERWPTMSVGPIPGPPDTHTLQVVRMQPLAHAVMDEWLEAELRRARSGGRRAPAGTAGGR